MGRRAFEGEGSISGKGNQVVLRMHLTDEDVLRRFAEIVGRGHVYGPYKNTEKGGFKRKPFGPGSVTTATNAA